MYIRTQRALAVGVSEGNKLNKGSISYKKTKVIRKIKTLFNRKEEGIPLLLIVVDVAGSIPVGNVIYLLATY